MSAKLIIFSVFMAVLFFTGCGKNDNKTVSDNSNSENKSENMVNKTDDKKDNSTLQVSATDKSVEIHTSGMTCTGCENTIKSKVKKVDGVKDVIADHKSNVVKASFDPAKTNPDAIKGAIESAGYKVESIK